MALFGKQPAGNPVQIVLQMRQQGMPDNQIVQVLQRQGFNSQQIFDAVSQADLSNLPPQAPPQQEGYPEAYPPQQQGYPPQEAPQEYAPQEQQPVSTGMDTRINEIAEAIINEKWEDVFGEIQKVIQWKEKMEVELQKIKDDIQAVKDEFNQLRQGLLGKIGEYDEHMRDVGSEIKAVHKVFQDVIPEFTENVAEISRVTKALKGKKKE